MSIELSGNYPRWVGPRSVQAFRIGQISHAPDGAAISPVDPGYTSVLVDLAWMDKHRPVIGGYYVIDDAGNTSFSDGCVFAQSYSQATPTGEGSQ